MVLIVFPHHHATAFWTSLQVRANAQRGSRTLNRSTVDLIAAAAANVATVAASNTTSPHAGGADSGIEVDATTIFDRGLRGFNPDNTDGDSKSTNPDRGGASAAGRPTRIPAGLATKIAAISSIGSATTAVRATRAATADHPQQEAWVDGDDHGVSGPREVPSIRAARELETALAAAAAAAEAELAQRRDPLWKYKQQVWREHDFA